MIFFDDLLIKIPLIASIDYALIEEAKWSHIVVLNYQGNYFYVSGLYNALKLAFVETLMNCIQVDRGLNGCFIQSILFFFQCNKQYDEATQGTNLVSGLDVITDQDNKHVS